MVGQMLDWTKCKNKLWSNELHKKQLLDTRFFEKKKFIDQQNHQQEQMYDNSIDASDQRLTSMGTTTQIKRLTAKAIYFARAEEITVYIKRMVAIPEKDTKIELTIVILRRYI